MTATMMEAINDGKEMAAKTAEETPKLADDAVAAAALETKVSGRLAGAFDAEAGNEELEEEVVDAEVETEAAAEVETETETEIESEVMDDPLEAAEKPKTKGGSPTLPEAWKRSAEARGYTPAEIDEALKEAPDFAMRTFERLHASRNAEIAAWAHAGRQHRQRETGTVDASEQPAPSPATPIPAQFPLVDEEALIEEFGNEAVVRAVAVPFNKMMAQVNAVLPTLVKGAKDAETANQQALVTSIEEYFTGKPLEVFGEFYGALAKGVLSQSQVDNRNKVLEMADAILAGAKLQGRDLGLAEALTAAHDAVSSDFRDKQARSALTKTAKARSAGRTLQPTGKRGAADRDDRSRSQSARERKVAANLKKAFSPG